MPNNMHQLRVIDFTFIFSWCCGNDHDVASKVVDGKDGNDATTEDELLAGPQRIWYACYNKM